MLLCWSLDFESKIVVDSVVGVDFEVVVVDFVVVGSVVVNFVDFVVDDVVSVIVSIVSFVDFVVFSVVNSVVDFDIKVVVDVVVVCSKDSPILQLQVSVF